MPLSGCQAVPPPGRQACTVDIMEPQTLQTCCPTSLPVQFLTALCRWSQGLSPSFFQGSYGNPHEVQGQEHCYVWGHRGQPARHCARHRGGALAKHRTRVFRGGAGQEYAAPIPHSPTSPSDVATETRISQETDAPPAQQASLPSHYTPPPHPHPWSGFIQERERPQPHLPEDPMQGTWPLRVEKLSLKWPI